MTRQGAYVYVDGRLVREGGFSAGRVNSILVVPTAFLPDEVYDTSGRVTLRGTVVNSSVTTTAVATIVINPDGYLDIIASAAGSSIRITGSYLAKNAGIPNPMTTPAVQGQLSIAGGVRSSWAKWMIGNDLEEGVHYTIYDSVGVEPKLASLAIHGGNSEYGAQEAAVEFARVTGASIYYMDIAQGFYTWPT